MENWLRISMVLCTFGFFREMRPSEPFVTEFLSGEWRNVTMEQVNRDVYPWGTYSYLSQLIIIFLITDMLRYKPVIVISGGVGIILWSLLLWTYTLEGLQIVQVFYGTFMAAEIAYYTYMYAKVDRSKYQQVTGHTRSAILSGRFLAGVLAQLLISFELMDTRELNYISLASQCVSLIWALLLPSVQTSMYFYSTKNPEDDDLNTNAVNIESNEKQSNNHNDTNNNSNNNNNNNNNHHQNHNGNANEENYLKKKTMTKIDNNDNKNNNDNVDFMKNNNMKMNNNNNNNNDDTKVSFSCTRAFRLLWYHFKTAYTNVIVLQWSIWWALAMCGFLIVQSYIQLLWADIQFGQGYNGAVEAALTLLGAFGAFGAGFLDSKQFNRFDIWILTICSAAEGCFILWAAFTDSIWIAYIMYILFGTLYHFMITVASATVAKKINEDSFALIFGINTLMALVLQTILTVVVISESGFMLDARGQFVVFGGYFIVLAIVYGTVAIIKSIVNR